MDEGLRTALDFLENTMYTEGEGYKFSTQVMCQNLCNNSYLEYERLYNVVNIIDIYMFAARSNAIHYASKEGHQTE